MSTLLVIWSVCIAVASSATFIYLIGWTSPLTANGQPNVLSLMIFFAALLSLSSSIGMLLAHQLHRRWPTLSGGTYHDSFPLAAVRQGILLAVAVTLNVLLILLQLFDITFVVVILLLVGLTEAFIQQK